MDVERGGSGVLTYSNGTCATPGLGRRCREPVWTPAFAMYNARNTALARAPLVPEDTRPMEIIWGNRVSELNGKWMSCTSERSLFHLYKMLRKDPLADKRKCPHTNTISVLHLLGPVDDDVQRAIAGKAVFYGGSFQMVGDRVVSPVYDDLPGVHLHAMAYDNLVTFTSDYKRADHDGFSLSSGVNGLLLLFTVLLLLLVDKPPAWAKKLDRRELDAYSQIQNDASIAMCVHVAEGTVEGVTAGYERVRVGALEAAAESLRPARAG